MILDLIRFCRGTVDFEIAGGYPERFIGLCGKTGIPLWRLRRQGKGLAASTSLGAAAKLRETAARSGVTLRICRQRGIPVLAKRYRMRTGIFAGLAALVIAPLVLSAFIWRVEITGCEQIPPPQLRQTLSLLGVRRGVLRPSVDTREVERRLMIAEDRLSWVGINLRGSTAYVEVRERLTTPEVLDVTTPYNVVAKKSGYIVSMEVYEGQPTVGVGDSVIAGDVLVSGIMENGKQESRLVHARANIQAQINDSLAVTVPYRRTVYGYRGLARRRSLCIGSLRIPLSAMGIPEQPWKLETAQIPVPVIGNWLPVTFLEQNYLLLEEAVEEITPDEARAEAAQRLEEVQRQSFAAGSVITRELTGQELEGKFVLFADYLRVAGIGEEQEILLGGSSHPEPDTPPE